MNRVEIKPKRRKNPGKGANYERAMCQRLSLWVSRLTREDVFWRSAMSGGRATLKSRKARESVPCRIRDNKGRVTRIKFDAHCGDITATHAVGNLLTELFVLECKHYASLEIDALFFKTRGTVVPFWEKVREEAHGTDREPLLAMRQNRQPDIVCMTREGKDIFGLPTSWALAWIPKLGMWVYLLSDLTEGVDFDDVRSRHQHPETVKELFRDRKKKRG